MSNNDTIGAPFVVVGGGIAGVSCVEVLAFYHPAVAVILLTESPIIKAATNLVALGKSLTRFDIEEKHASSLPGNITVIIDRLHKINSATKTIETVAGKTIKYEYLCLGTGARPKLIEQGQENKYVLGIRDTESVVEFQKRIEHSRRIAIVGNGGIASELIYELKKVAIDWIIKDKYVSQTFVDPGAAAFFQSRIANGEKVAGDGQTKASILKRMRYGQDDATSADGTPISGAALGPDWHTLFNLTGTSKDLPKTVAIHYNTEVKDIKINSTAPSSEFPVQMTLTSGETIDCDFVVSATGVIPHLNFIADVDFKIGSDGGIAVNELMETSIARIYAAGDLAHADWNLSSHWFQMRLWTQARQMGAMAGKSMSAAFNDEPVYSDFCFELFGHVTQLFGYQLVLLGKYNGQGLGTDYEALLRMTRDQEYIKYVLVNGRLQGAILIGETGLEETTENLILNQLDLSPYGDDVLNPDIDIEDYFD